MKVKICGITCQEDAALCDDMGADALGLVHVPGRARSISLDSISEICSTIGPITPKVLVCQPRTADMALEMLGKSGADMLQVYSLGFDDLLELRDCGTKVMRVVKPSDEDAERLSTVAAALVFEDGTPGTGAAYDYSNIPVRLRGRSFIAGGLTPETVGQAKALRPYGVDVSSGVEVKTGRKDPRKVEEFIRRSRS